MVSVNSNSVRLNGCISFVNKAVWIPLKAYVDIERVNKYGTLGYIWNAYNIKSVLIPLNKIKEINTLSWDSFIINDTDSGYKNENNGTNLCKSIFLKFFIYKS